MLKVNNRNTRKRWKICSNLTLKTLKQHHWRRSDIFIVNFEHTSPLFLLLYYCLWTGICFLGKCSLDMKYSKLCGIIPSFQRAPNLLKIWESMYDIISFRHGVTVGFFTRLHLTFAIMISFKFYADILFCSRVSLKLIHKGF